MTLECPECGTIDVELVEDNGVTDPTETRLEAYECVNGHEFTKTLPGEGGRR